nr:hypothetical protein [Tanacetum cinerariifolium]
IENEEFDLKPMNYQDHCVIFNKRPRSYTVDLTNEFLSSRYYMKDIGEADVIFAAALVLVVVVYGGTNDLKEKYTRTMNPTTQTAAAIKNSSAGMPSPGGGGGSGRRHWSKRKARPGEMEWMIEL